MPEGLYLGFDFGYKRIGVAVGQALTKSASPLETIAAQKGVPEWSDVMALIKQWRPSGLVVGLPTRIDGKEQYTTKAARIFAQALSERFSLPVDLVDERLTTVEARAQLYLKGGYRKIQKSQVDSVAACLILEQWLQNT
ncbi:MAG: Holliday junction resolvase RuvX [Gammaproteobacteria bacterium]|nr:Holliday junction resolvase RuvX [Gammaproteobacteria bacterium]